MIDKNEIRKQMKILKSSLSNEIRILEANSVFSKLENSDIFKNAQNILMYHSLPDELYTHDFIDKWCSSKNIFLPRVCGEDLEILPYHKDNIKTGAFKIEEPTGNESIDPNEIELIVVPAVAFDKKLNRLGRGRGYYDRLLKSTNAIKIGVGYDFQLLDRLPVEKHDIPMNIIITPNHIIENK